MRRWILRAGGVAAGIVVLLWAWKLAVDARYFHDYDPGLPFNAAVEETREVNDTDVMFGRERPRHYQRTKLRFQSRPGEMIPVLLTFPPEYEGRLPVIILLHGIGQNKEFLDEITAPFNDAGFAMACFDQSMRGERRIKGGWLKEAVAFRQRPWKTVNDARRLIDYLETHPDIDPDRIYLLGASYGAITGCSLAAFDKRIRAADLLVGGGNLPVLLDAPVLRGNSSPWLYAIGKRLMVSMMRPADPVRYAAQTSPTPLLFQNGSEDKMVTPDAARELYNAAGEPKELRWYPCNHPGLNKNDNPIVLEMLDDAVKWFVEQDQRHRKAAIEEMKPAA